MPTPAMATRCFIAESMRKELAGEDALVGARSIAHFTGSERLATVVPLGKSAKLPPSARDADSSLKERTMNATPALREADVPTLAHWIGGKRTPGTSGRFGDVYTPATGALGARVPFASAAEVGRAVDAAK